MSATVQVRERAGGQTTCVWCHADATSEEAVPCVGCGALYHAACRDEAGRCGTLGCPLPFPQAERPGPRAYAPGARAARCAGCGAEGGVLGLARCPDGGGLYHRACRSSACARCRARADHEAPTDGRAALALVLESLRVLAKVLLGVTAAAGVILFVRSLPEGVRVPYLVMVLGPVLAVGLLQRWR